MIFKFIKIFLLFACCLFFACTLSNNRPLRIDFSADSTQLVFSEIDPAGLAALKENLKTDSAYQKLVSVLQTPSDEDTASMEIEWPGKLALDGDRLIFTPDTAFRKGKTYLVETMLNTHFADKKEVLSAEVGHRVRPQQRIFKR